MKRKYMMLFMALLAGLACIWWLPARAESPNAKDTKFADANSITYQVKKGDTLYRLALNYQSTVETLMKVNHITDPTLLQINQMLTIPVIKSVSEPVSIHSTDSNLVKHIKSPYQSVIEATLTAYTAGYESTGKTPSHPEYGITYSGKRAKEGRTVAVDPKLIPLGSTIYIEGIGMRTAEDIGSAVKGKHIDVFMNDVQLAREFGVKKNQKVYILSVPDAS